MRIFNYLEIVFSKRLFSVVHAILPANKKGSDPCVNLPGTSYMIDRADKINQKILSAFLFK